MPERLWSMPASTLGDDVAHWPAGTSVETLTRQAMPDPFCKEVRHIAPKPGGGFTVKFIDTRTQEAFSREFDCVVYTPHVRVLDKLRYADGAASLEQMNPLLPEGTWEAVMNTHYMQSTKIFASTTTPFWEERDPVDGKRKMSVTLSDRLTRGTYLVDYGPSLGAYRAAECSFPIHGMTMRSNSRGIFPPRKRCAPICWNPSIQRPTSAVLRRLGYLRENELG